ncbi:MAG: VWA domain-containing protein [Gemmataceae bacterium]|nr:VWA domain-containing protein [Gemmataceae bacterium]
MRHPSLDRELTGLGSAEDEPDEGEGDGSHEPVLTNETEGPGKGRNLKGGQRRFKNYRGPVEYGELLRALGSGVSQHEATIRYYRERAIPYLVRFPTRTLPQATDPMPEGLEGWDFGMPLEDADWLQSVLTSPHVVPGMTTMQRTYGTTPGADPERRPVDLYLGVDCSGSMFNPQYNVSFPVLAGSIMALSALRAGARVMVVLSGEPGQSIATDGFISDEHKILEVLTGYLGTGYTFGVHRLRDTFGNRKPGERPAHILIVTDHDIFSMLDTEGGWEVARESVQKAGGGGTYVMNMPRDWEPEKVARMRADGWGTYHVQDWEELIAFAQAFSKQHYEEGRRG